MIVGGIAATAPPAAAGRAACACGADPRGRTTACTVSIRSGNAK